MKCLLLMTCPTPQPMCYRASKQASGIRPAFEKLDLQDAVGVKKLFETYSISGIIHFAAFKAVRRKCIETHCLLPK